MTPFRILPETVTFTLALYLLSLYALASVDEKLRHVAAWAPRDITDVFLFSDFDVYCLGNSVGIEFVSKLRWSSGRVHKLLVRRISRVVLRSGLRRCVQSQVPSLR